MKGFLKGSLLVLLSVALVMMFGCGALQGQPNAAGTGAAFEESQGTATQDVSTPEQPEPESLDESTRLTAFSARDIQGNTVTDAVFAEAELTMLNVWGTFCGPCLNEMPDLGALSSEYAEKGLQIIGLVGDVRESDEDAAYVQEIVDKTGANYRHLLPSADLQNKLLSNLMYYPTTIFYDKNGYMIDKLIVGAHTKSEWQVIIDRMLDLAKSRNAAEQEGADSAPES